MKHFKIANPVRQTDLHFNKMNLSFLVAIAIAVNVKGIVPCPCGYVGDSCNQTGYYDVNDDIVLTTVTAFPNGTCVPANVYSCSVDEKTVSCNCILGFKGDLCDEEVELLPWNLVLGGFVLPISFIVVSLLFYRRYSLKVGGEDFDIPQEACTQGFASAPVLLVYRLAMVGICLSVIISQYINRIEDGEKLSWIYRYFTNLNFHLLLLYFIIGCVLSIKRVFTENLAAERLNHLEKFFYLIMETELPSTYFIATVYWAVLYNGGTLTYTNIMVHGLNTMMITGDFFLNRLHFNKHHIWFAIIWTSMYTLFHGILMTIEFANDQPHAPVYGFLSYASPFLPAVLVGLVMIFAVFYAIAYQCNRCAPGPQASSAKEDRITPIV